MSKFTKKDLLFISPFVVGEFANWCGEHSNNILFELFKNFFYSTGIIIFILFVFVLIPTIKAYYPHIKNVIISLFSKEQNDNKLEDNVKINTWLLIFLNVLSFLLVLYLTVFLEFKSVTSDESNYAEFIIEGNTFFSEEFFERSKSDDFINNKLRENPDKFYPSALIYALENKTENYQTILQSAYKNGFSLKQEFSFNWHQYNLKNEQAKEMGFNQFAFTVYKRFFEGQPKKITVSQFILGYSYTDFTEEYLTFLDSLNFDFNEGITLRKDFINFLNSAFTANSPLQKDLEYDLNYSDMQHIKKSNYKKFIEYEEEQLNKLITFYKKNN